MTVINPFDFFVEPVRDELSVRLSERVRRGACALSQQGAGRSAAHRISAVAAARAAEHHRLPRRAQSAAAARDRLSDPHGAGRADAGGDADAGSPAPAATRPGCWCRCCAISASPARFVSGYLIQLKPDLKALDGPAGTDAGLHRPARLGRGLSAGRRLDRARPTSGPADRRGPIPLAATPHYRSAAPISGGVEPAKVEFAFEMRVDAHRREAARHLAVLRRGLGRARRARRTGRRRSRRAGRAPDHGRRADLRVGRRLRGGRMEHRGGRPDQARPGRRADPPAARRFAPGGLAASRPGQMVSGRDAAALGLLAVLAHATASRSGRTPR